MMRPVTRRQLLVGTATFAGASLVGQEQAQAGDGAAGPARPAGGWAPEELVTRAGWDADESIRIWDADFSPVQVLTVHHSAAAAGDDAAAAVRAIYRAHTLRRGWGDIGYHLLIDPDGVLYEGRHPGADDVPVFGSEPDGDEPVRCVTAGHVRGYNPGNIGICVLGDFTSTVPTEDATDTLERTLAGLCDLCDLDPAGTTGYVNPDTGATRAAPTISGHRDWAATGCPGNAFAGEFAALRGRVAERMT